MPPAVHFTPAGGVLIWSSREGMGKVGLGGGGAEWAWAGMEPAVGISPRSFSPVSGARPRSLTLKFSSQHRLKEALCLARILTRGKGMNVLPRCLLYSSCHSTHTMLL